MRHDGEYRILQERLRGFFADKPAKVIARDTGADLRTVNGWKTEGRLPMTARHWWALTLAYRDLKDVLFNPDQEAVAQRLDAEHHALCEEPGAAATPALGETDQAAVTAPSRETGR